MLTQIVESEAVAHLIGDRTGAHDLSSVCDRHHACSPVHVGAEPIAVTLGRLARVQPHAHPQLQGVGPGGRV